MTPEERIGEITQQMLLDYTAWVNGEPIAWNVKKKEHRASLLQMLKDKDAENYKAVMEVIGEDEENVMNRALQETQRQRVNKFFGRDK